MSCHYYSVVSLLQCRVIITVPCHYYSVMLDFFCDIMECLLTVPSAKCDQIENESGPISYRKADCNTTFPVHFSKKGSKLGVHESKTLGKTSKTNTGDFSIYLRKV